MNERGALMQTMNDSKTNGYHFPDRSKSDDSPLPERKTSHLATDASLNLMAGADELWKAITSIFQDTCQRRERCREMLHQCWESFI